MLGTVYKTYYIFTKNQTSCITCIFKMYGCIFLFFAHENMSYFIGISKNMMSKKKNRKEKQNKVIN